MGAKDDILTLSIDEVETIMLTLRANAKPSLASMNVLVKLVKAFAGRSNLADGLWYVEEDKEILLGNAPPRRASDGG